jgi:hypothetical protein
MMVGSFAAPRVEAGPVAVLPCDTGGPGTIIATGGLTRGTRGEDTFDGLGGNDTIWFGTMAHSVAEPAMI